MTAAETETVRAMIPSALRQLTRGAESVELPARDVRGLLRALDARFPGFSAELGPSFAVSIDGEIIQDPLLEPITPGCEVHFLCAVSGGC